MDSRRSSLFALAFLNFAPPLIEQEFSKSMDRLTGIHAVREALEANRPLDSLIVARGSHGNRIEELVRLARQHDIPVRFEERIQLDRTAGTREHQGVVALVAASPSASFEDLLKPRDLQTGPGLLVLDERAEKRHTEVDFKVPVGVVLGGEGKGLHALVRERCDFLVSIPTTGPVRALNVSVAAGVVLFEAVRQREAEKSKPTTSLQEE